MAALKSYFHARIGRTLTWSFEGGSGRFGEPFRREYSYVIIVSEHDSLSAKVCSNDFDKAGRKLTRVDHEYGAVSVSTSGVLTPVQALEDLARAADPAYFERHPRVERSQQADSADGIEAKLKALEQPESRGKGEAPPLPASVERFRKFWAENAGLFMPEVFSSKDGSLRARWQDGHDRTLWINFPDKGPLGWSVSVPRQGASGLRRMNARCPDDQDIVPFAAALGVRCKA